MKRARLAGGDRGGEAVNVGHRAQHGNGETLKEASKKEGVGGNVKCRLEDEAFMFFVGEASNVQKCRSVLGLEVIHVKVHLKR